MGEESTRAANEMREALSNLLDGLTRTQRERANHAFTDHTERANWAYFPKLQRGLALADLNHRQQRLVHRLLRASLSFPAYVQANTIMAMENVLDEIEGRRTVTVRDEALYYVTVFTNIEDAFAQPRGFRIQGHHISVNYTLARDGVVAMTPLFLGSNPARVRHDGRDIVRPLGETEDRARELLDSFRPEQRAKAIVYASAPPDFVLGILPQTYTPFVGRGVPGLPNITAQFGGGDALEAMRFDAQNAAGIPAEDLTDGQRDLLARLLSVYTSRFPDGVGWPGLTDISELHFAWAGSTELDEGHYYRLQSPSVVIEYDNTQNDANHVHTVLRHPKNDFGADALGLHHLWDHASGEG